MQTSKPLFSIVIASHNMRHVLLETLKTCVDQDYSNLEIVILDDASTDGTDKIIKCIKHPKIKYFRSKEPSGTGGAFNKAIFHANGKYLMLLCADDLITDKKLVSDLVDIFESNKNIGHISRYYHQFISGDRSPVRAWRSNDIIELANNPSGLAFRTELIGSCELSNKMFVEASNLVSCVINKGCDYCIIPWDTVAVRIHQSISQNKNYYLKMWKSSPVEEWVKVGGNALLRDYTSLIQIKNNFQTRAVVNECANFIKYRPLSVLFPSFWFFAIISIFTPRCILRRIPDLYRRTIGKLTTKEIKRP